MAPKLLIKVRLVEVRDEAEGIRSLTFVPVTRPDLPPWHGGAHVILRLPDGVRRSYSLCGDPSDRGTYRVAVQREPDSRGGSEYLHAAAHVGDEFYLTHPQDDFTLAPDASRHILIAGGIGITPILGMLRDRPSGTRTEVHYCVSTSSRAAFLTEVRELADAVTLYPSDAGRRLDVSRLLAEHTPGDHVYCCGPASLGDAVEAAAAHWPDGTVHRERFVGAAPERGDPFDVELVASRKTLHVPADQTLLQVLREAGITVDSSCEGGLCRSCRVGVVAGTPVHRDLVLSDSQRESSMLACVSRGEGVLRLLL
ncbi:PDR/VanB family oxidoreductase [Cryptosporangium sp. NPDC048952]|uniref:PDR/VanB family oxidoreductase n=1 Tax=Cryptosporangium sp. NPDC048952 TaxID=3363961 RepID=UPI00370FEF75